MKKPEICPIHRGRCGKDIQPKSRQAFVIMPFREDEAPQSLFTDILLNLHGWNAHRVDRNYDEPDGLCAICKDIQESEVVITDLSRINPNVMLELGMAFGMGVPFILITQNHEELKDTFDIMRLRAIKYERDPNNSVLIKDRDILLEDIQMHLTALERLQSIQSDFFEMRKGHLLEKNVGKPSHPPKMNMGLLVGPSLPNQELFPSRIDWVEEFFRFSPAVRDVKGYPNHTFLKYSGSDQPVTMWNAKVWPNGVLEVAAELVRTSNNDIDLVILTSFILNQVLFLFRALKFSSWTGRIKVTIAIGGVNDTPLQVYYKGHKHLDETYTLPVDETWVAMTVEEDVADNVESILNFCKYLIREVSLCFGFKIGPDAMRDVLRHAFSAVSSHAMNFSVGGIQVPTLEINEDMF